MCLITFSYKENKKYPFILVANRDEFYNRPTADMQFWPDNEQLLAGRDLQQGGTWLGIHLSGRIAAITNYRKKNITKQKQLQSRGNIITAALNTTQTAGDFVFRQSELANQYNGYNLLNADKTGFYYSNNQADSAKKLSPGTYGLCNGCLDEPWPKLIAAKKALQQIVFAPHLTIDTLKNLLNDKARQANELLPQTGISLEWEKALSSQFIQLDTYGTRAKTIIIQDNEGITQILEQRFDATGWVSESSFRLKLPPLG